MNLEWQVKWYKHLWNRFNIFREIDKNDRKQKGLVGSKTFQVFLVIFKGEVTTASCFSEIVLKNREFLGQNFEKFLRGFEFYLWKAAEFYFMCKNIFLLGQDFWENLKN